MGNRAFRGALRGGEGADLSPPREIKAVAREGEEKMKSAAAYRATHFLWEVEGKVATLTLNRPERKNPLTFDSYAELRDLFRGLTEATDVKCVVIRGAGDNFCSGGDVHEIIGPLTEMDLAGLKRFTTLTGDLVKAMRACPQPSLAAIV